MSSYTQTHVSNTCETTIIKEKGAVNLRMGIVRAVGGCLREAKEKEDWEGGEGNVMFYFNKKYTIF